MMRDYWLNRTLQRIEREANDDLRQILSLGAHYYSTAELHYLLDQLEWQRLLASEELKALYRRSAAIPLAIGLTILFVYFNLTEAALFAAAGSIVMAPLFLLQSLTIRRRHPTYYYHKTIKKLIHQELDRRRFQVDSR